MRTRATRILGWATALSLALTAVLALVVSPADVNQKDAVRLLYLHVPTAWLAMYVSFGVTTLASALYLWPRTRSRFWDLTAGASAEIGVVFLGLTLLIGSIWGRTTWGVWWTWDARLTTTAVLLVLYLGYLAVRRVVADPEVAAKRAAIVAIAAFLDVPVVHQSVEWWRTLHQPASLFDERRLLDPQITGVMLVTLLVSVLAFTLLYAWLLIHRFRLAWLEDRAADRRMELALAERHAEATMADAPRPSGAGAPRPFGAPGPTGGGPASAPAGHSSAPAGHSSTPAPVAPAPVAPAPTPVAPARVVPPVAPADVAPVDGSRSPVGSALEPTP
ncbi:MAG: heme exporter protein [Actinomycetota bacterium]|jgi:heme exporter protein C|nr:heme exporter protein [Actinomycetota bacterium]